MRRHNLKRNTQRLKMSSHFGRDLLKKKREGSLGVHLIVGTSDADTAAYGGDEF